MYYDVVQLIYVKDYILELKFENGKKGSINLREYLDKGGIFKSISNISYFKKVFINKELGVISWPNGLDIAPETIYHKVTGEPLPHWMEN